MAEITTGSPTLAPPATPATVPSFSLQKVENTVFAFLQTHYAKVVAVIIGYATSSYGLIGKLLGKLF